MSFRSSEAAIDEIVASCNGDLRGALKALLLVNEHLEAEIAQLYAAAVQYGLPERWSTAPGTAGARASGARIPPLPRRPACWTRRWPGRGSVR